MTEARSDFTEGLWPVLSGLAPGCRREKETSDPGELGVGVGDRRAEFPEFPEPCLPRGVLQQERGFEPSGVQKLAQGNGCTEKH